MKNRAFVGQPILAAAVFQAAFSRLHASLAEGTGAGFSTLTFSAGLHKLAHAPSKTRDAAAGKFCVFIPILAHRSGPKNPRACSVQIRVNATGSRVDSATKPQKPQNCQAPDAARSFPNNFIIPSLPIMGGRTNNISWQKIEAQQRKTPRSPR
jgi:hypothetical protein